MGRIYILEYYHNNMEIEIKISDKEKEDKIKQEKKHPMDVEISDLPE